MADENNARWKNLLWGFIFLGLGIWMLTNPELMDGADASGRRALFKSILIWAWGIPGGIISLLIGGATLYFYFKGDSAEEASTS